MTARPNIHAAITPRVAPTLAVRAKTAADSLDISLGSFLALVKEGKMPSPITVSGHPGLVLYDFEAVRDAWQTLKEALPASRTDEWE
jgi:hypothetical protein